MDFKEAAKPISVVGNSDIGILFSHGISSTPGSLKYLIDGMIKAGYHVEVPLLPGHGETWERLCKVSRHDWLKVLQESEDKLKKRCRKVFAAGLSLGGGLLLKREFLGANYSGLILINHICVLKGAFITLAPVFRHLIARVPGVASDIKDKNAGKEPAYKWLATNAGWETICLSNELQKDMKHVQVPALIFKSRIDHVVPVDSATYTMQHLASPDKHLIWLENSFHVAPMDYDKELIVQEMLKFIKARS